MNLLSALKIPQHNVCENYSFLIFRRLSFRQYAIETVFNIIDRY
jgi:hypothetical protein